MIVPQINLAKPTYVLWIPAWTPTSLNALMYAKARQRMQLIKADRDIVGLWAKAHRIPEATTVRVVSLHVTLPSGGRQLDPDNCWKSLLDALTHARLIKDDAARWCLRGEIVWSRSGSDYKETFVRLEDV